MADEKRDTAGGLPELPSETVAHVAKPLPCDVRAPGVARGWVRGWCQVLDVVDEVVDAVTLAVSELVTNAIAHGTGPVWLRLAQVQGGNGLAVEVYDAAPVTPSLRDALDMREPEPGEADDGLPGGGRGLGIVRALAASVGLLADPAAGKTIRVLFPLPTP